LIFTEKGAMLMIEIWPRAEKLKIKQTREIFPNDTEKAGVE
jgi:hypothetical protein